MNKNPRLPLPTASLSHFPSLSKVNNERWYYYTDTMGILVLQDMIQHYGDAFTTPDPALYWQDLEAMMTNL